MITLEASNKTLKMFRLLLAVSQDHISIRNRVDRTKAIRRF